MHPVPPVRGYCGGKSWTRRRAVTVGRAVETRCSSRESLRDDDDDDDDDEKSDDDADDVVVGGGDDDDDNGDELCLI